MLPSKLPQLQEFKRPELEGFAWNYSTDSYGIVSDNRGYSTNVLRRYLIIWHRLSLLDTSPRKYKIEWEWVNPSIVSHRAGAKSLLEAVFRDREKGEDEFFKTCVRIINPYTVTVEPLVALVEKALHMDLDRFFKHTPLIFLFIHWLMR